jgi:lysophospholipase L1-like esterase
MPSLLTELFANAFATTLAQPCGLNDAQIVVASAAPPALNKTGQFHILVDSEYMLVTGGQSGTTWNVTRGVEGVQQAHVSNVPVYHFLTAGVISSFAAKLPAQTLVTVANTPLMGTHNSYDATTAAISITLPANPGPGDQISFEKYDSGSNYVTITGNIRSGVTIQLQWQHETVIFTADASGVWWPLAGHKTITSILAAINTAVTAAIASNSSVTAAAVAAVAAATSAGGFVPGGNTIDSNTAFTVTDSKGHRSWIESGYDGKPTANSLNAFAVALVNNPTLAAAIESAIQSSMSPVSGLGFVITDSVGKRSDIELTPDGHFSPRVISLLAARLGVGNGSVTLASLATDASGRVNATVNYQAELQGGNLYVNNLPSGARVLISTGNSPVFQEITADGYVLWTDSTGAWARKADASGPVIPQAPAAFAAWGDSLTWGQSNGVQIANPYPAILATLLSVSVQNEGYPGQASTDVAIHQGGVQPLLTVTGNQIPISGSVTITAMSPVTSYRLSSASTFNFVGTLAGVPGTLAHNDPAATWTFTPSTYPSTLVTCPPGTPFIEATGNAYRACTQIFWNGQNNGDGGENYSDVIRDVASMVAWLTPRNKRFLVMSISTATGETSGTALYIAKTAINAQLAALYPNNYLDIREYLVQNGIAAANALGYAITPTTADMNAIAGDTPPPSLHNTADTVHFNQAGYAVIGNAVYNWLLSKGWTV